MIERWGFRQLSNDFLTKLGVLFKSKSFSKLAKNFDLLEKRDFLYQEMLNCDKPHLLNQKLNKLEHKLGLSTLYSFPTYVTLSMTTDCNARCSFCNYAPKRKELRDYLTVSEVQKMSWLKYVSTLNLNGGLSDSLVNVEFLNIFRYIKDNFSHLNLTISTNGIGLTEEICENFLNNMSYVLVSINPSTKKTWTKIMRTKGFDNVIEMSSYLAKIKKKNSVSKPELIISMVLLKDNIHEAPEFVELAKKIGANKVIFQNYLLTAVIGKKDFDESHSLYYHQEYYDEMMEKASQRAKKHGIELVKPLGFDKKNYYISLGEKSKQPPISCKQPWTNCFLSCLPGNERHREIMFCCIGIPYRIPYDKSRMTETYFIKNVWNHPVAKYMRKTVNNNKGNPICSFCRNFDRFDPSSLANFNEAFKNTDQMFKKMAEKFELATNKIHRGTNN